MLLQLQQHPKLFLVIQLHIISGIPATLPDLKKVYKYLAWLRLWSLVSCWGTFISPMYKTFPVKYLFFIIINFSPCVDNFCLTRSCSYHIVSFFIWQRYTLHIVQQLLREKSIRGNILLLPLLSSPQAGCATSSVLCSRQTRMLQKGQDPVARYWPRIFSLSLF